MYMGWLFEQHENMKNAGWDNDKEHGALVPTNYLKARKIID